jgi:rod shape-determining protein MreC
VAIYRRARSTRLLVLSLVVVSLMTITVDFRGGRTGPFETFGSQVALTVVGPLQSAMTKVFHPVAAFFHGLVHVGSLESENNALRDENAKLRSQVSTTASIERERERLLRLFELEQRLGLAGVGAEVIGESVSNFEWSVTINKGSSSGLRLDMPVISDQGLVGRVTAVASNWSTVQLIIDPHSAVAARLVSSGETGLLVGRAKNAPSMDLVTPEAVVQPNEQVVTSGYQGGLYPPDILIGFVSSTYTRPGSLTKSLLIRPAVDFSALEFVEVVTGHQGKAHR